MTDCADSTMLRTHLDHPDEALERHLDECHACTGLLNDVAHDAGYARSRLSLLDVDAHDVSGLDVDARFSAITDRRPESRPTPVAPRHAHRPRRRGRVVVGAVAAAAVAAIGVSPTGRATVADALDAFRGDRFEAVGVDLGTWADAPVYEGIRALEDLGDVVLDDLVRPVEVGDLDEAAAVAGIVPPAVPRPPDRVAAMAPGTVRIELERRADNDVPAALDGAAVVVDVPGAIVALFGVADDGGPPELVVGRSGSLSITAERASLEDVRTFLLSLDELPVDLRAQLEDIDDWRSTIPVPVPLDGPGWTDVEIGGRPAVAFGDDSGMAALVLRSDPDGITVVGGRMSVSRAIELMSQA